MQCLTLFNVTPRSQKWDYKIEAIPDLSFDEAMQQLGDEGWELTFARRTQGSYDEFSYECIFKRQR